MKFKTRCISCGIEILFGKTDIKKVPQKHLDSIEKQNKEARELLNKTEMRGFFFKKEVKVYQGYFIRELLRTKIRNPVGFIKCQVCEGEQFILKSEHNSGGKRQDG